MQLIDDKLFRKDLYYRLNIVSLHLIPLRERKSDIADLVSDFTQQYTKTHQQKRMIIPADILNIFHQYDWPGNIRELRNVIEQIQESPSHHSSVKEQLKQKLSINGSNLLGKKQTAQELNISLVTLYRKLKKYELDK